MALPPATARAQTPAAVRVNQVGFVPSADKFAIVAGPEQDTTFVILSAAGGDTVFRGRLSWPRRWAPSAETVRQADFSALRRRGSYVIETTDGARSPRFTIGDTVLRPVARAALKAFYYQRASTALPARYAGRWARAAAHPDTHVVVHPSAASAARPSGTVIRSPGGWYDAGDYNKYVVNSGISTYELLALAEDFPDYAARLSTNVPESANALPDVLDEALWNLRWMLTMQDPSDGGVYHKLTNAEFDAFIAPDRATTTRFVVQKSTAATLDFAAVAAHASLIVRRYPRELPALADSLLRAARAAWTWASLHPDSMYDQARLNANAAPPIHTGAYGDRDVSDERQWAAAELFLATRDTTFLRDAAPLAPPPLDVPSWGSVRTLGIMSLVRHRGELPASVDAREVESRLLALADALVARARSSAYGVSLGGPRDFVWGSNGVAANQGLVLVRAFLLTHDSTYLHVAQADMDYLLGRNATGYAFLTGFGTLSPRHPHHRLSATDGVDDPIPGLLVGGPSPGQQDRCAGYPTTVPARSYVDETCAYAANEVAINWNAPFAYLAAALDALAPR